MGTFQAYNLEEGRYLYDMLIPLAPIMLAISAASPAWRGILSENDSRWNVASQGNDDRTPEERNSQSKSRFCNSDCYLTSDYFNDEQMVYDEESFSRMTKAGMDTLLAKHFAGIFSHDTIALYEEKLVFDERNDQISTDHFENIQSTVWQPVRFKPPPAMKSTTGWRVEFRPCEMQLSDFENAALSVFAALLTRVIL